MWEGDCGGWGEIGSFDLCYIGFFVFGKEFCFILSIVRFNWKVLVKEEVL